MHLGRPVLFHKYFKFDLYLLDNPILPNMDSSDSIIFSEDSVMFNTENDVVTFPLNSKNSELKDEENPCFRPKILRSKSAIL